MNSNEEMQMGTSHLRQSLVALAALAFLGMAAVQAASLSFTVRLTGAQQVPPVHTRGTGTAKLTYNSATRLVTWHIRFSHLSSAATMAHFHYAPDGQNGPVVLWLTHRGGAVTSPITGRATLSPTVAKEFLAGDLYINLHTKDHPGGELRGQIRPPETK
jgi:hypothetical protein